MADWASLGLVVGLAAEARVARPFGVRIAIGGGDEAGAARAAAELAAQGVRGLISFGLAGGLDPALAPGAVIVPRAVLAGGQTHLCDPALGAALGGLDDALLIGGGAVVARAADKARLFAETGAAAVDLESGAVAAVAARHNLPFAVLRAVCDPATRDLPPAALIALDPQGRIGLLRVMASLARDPRQIPGLIRLAGDAARARKALQTRVAQCAHAQKTDLREMQAG